MENNSNTQGVLKMVRPIMRDPLFLAGKSEPATEADKQVVQDLLDTLKANQDRCVGIRTIVPGTINSYRLGKYTKNS